MISSHSKNSQADYFHPDKGHVLTPGKFANLKYVHRYEICEKEIKQVFDEKNLDVTPNAEQRFDEQIAWKVREANSIVGEIRRAFSYLDCKSFRKMLTSFVRLGSHSLLGKLTLENVQIRPQNWSREYATLNTKKRLYIDKEWAT